MRFTESGQFIVPCVLSHACIRDIRSKFLSCSRKPVSSPEEKGESKSLYLTQELKNRSCNYFLLVN